MNIWNVRFLNIKGTTPCDLQEIVTKTDSKVDDDSVLDETSSKRQSDGPLSIERVQASLDLGAILNSQH